MRSKIPCWLAGRIHNFLSYNLWLGLVSTKPRLNESPHKCANLLFSKFLHNSLLPEIFDEKVLTFSANRLSESLHFEICVELVYIIKKNWILAFLITEIHYSFRDFGSFWIVLAFCQKYPVVSLVLKQFCVIFYRRKKEANIFLWKKLEIVF